MFDAKFIQGLQAAGQSVSDAVRALRPGGPMERLGIRTRCLSCGTEVAESIKWFHVCDMRCQCGGDFDPVPMCALVAWAQTSGTTDAEFPASAFRIQQDSTHES